MSAIASRPRAVAAGLRSLMAEAGTMNEPAGMVLSPLLKEVSAILMFVSLSW